MTGSRISQTHTSDYCGNVIYENGTFSKILTEEGHVTLSGTTPTYHYYLKGHQGNNRVQQSLLEGIESIANQDVAASPEYNNQRKRERDEKDKRNQEQANVAKSIDTNVSGTMPNGAPALKRDPNDGGDKTRVAIGVTTIGAGAAVVESVVEGTQPQETVSQQPEVKPQESEKNNCLLYTSPSPRDA